MDEGVVGVGVDEAAPFYGLVDKLLGEYSGFASGDAHLGETRPLLGPSFLVDERLGFDCDEARRLPFFFGGNVCELSTVELHQA